MARLSLSATRSELLLPNVRAIAVASARVGRDEALTSVRVAFKANLFPPGLDGGDRKHRRVMVNAHAHETGVGGEVVDAVRNRCDGGLATLPTASLGKSWTSTSSGSPCGCHSRPPFLKLPTNSFFFVSTEITGTPRLMQLFALALMCSNCELRSGC